MLETLGLMGAGFVNALTPINLLMMAGGVALGIIIGCMPGLSAAMGVALMLPRTFTMKAETGLIVLGAIVYVALMHFFGFYISTVIFMAAVLLYLRVPILHSAIAIVAILALVYFAFGKFLGVRLPVGTVIKMLR